VHDARRTCGSLLADLDVHPRVAMNILRHARFSITREIYTEVSSKATREALKRLGRASMGDRCCTGTRRAMLIDGASPLSRWAILGSNQ
jgi:hypothetical protein